MKFVISLFLYCLIYLPVAVVSYILLDESIFIIFSCIALTSWLFIYIYIDRILLIFLGAREVIDTDEHRFFQVIKNNAYKNRVIPPRVYIYNGNYEGCFLLESFSKWIVVLDKNFMVNLSAESAEKLVEFFYSYHTKGVSGFLKTKALGICVLFNAFIYWTMKYLFFQRTDSKLFKTFVTFAIIMTRPFLYPFEYLLRRSLKIRVDNNLEQYSSQLKLEDSFIDFVSDLVLEERKLRALIVKYMENYPLLLECEFSHDY